MICHTHNSDPHMDTKPRSNIIKVYYSIMNLDLTFFEIYT